jgi:hypothetical protein
MSGKYSDVRLAYTPLDDTNPKGELFFKTTRVQTGTSSSARVAGSDILEGFVSGQGAWTVTPPAAGQAEIAAFVGQSRHQLENLDNDARKKIAKKVIDLRGKGDQLSQRILRLFDEVYVFTYRAAGAAGPVPATATVSPIPHLDSANIGQGASATQAVLTVEHQSSAHILVDFFLGAGTGVDLRATVAAGAAVASNTPFNWDEGQYLAQWLGSTTASQADDVYDKLILSAVAGTDFDKVTRRGSDGELEINTDGKGWKSLKDWSKGRNQCQQVGIAGTSATPAKCVANALACMKGNTDGSPIAITDATCLTALKDPELWKAGKDDVKNINPKAAFMLLKNLGFKGKKSGSMVKCEPYSDWEKRVNDNELTKDDGSKVDITTHQADMTAALPGLKGFLELVVGYVDSNPQILNQGSNFSSSGSLDANDPFGLKRPRNNDKSGSLDDFRNAASNSLDGVHLHVSGIMAALGHTHTHTHGLMGLLSGGGAVPGYLAPSGTAPLKAKVSRFSYRLEEVYNHYLARLSNMNKSLSNATQQKVKSVFTNLKEKEDELIKWVEYIERYQEIIQLSGDNRQKKITDTDLKDAYTKYEKNHTKLRKRTINLIDILSTLSNATSDAESGDVNLPSSV